MTGSYRRYANLHRPYVVWSVFATPELSLELHKWCFLVVGCINYRGYYAQEDAQRYAATLRSQGLETYVAGVPAYSTLGYFDDPLLNTFVYLPEGELARMLFHELAHQVVYVRNDTTFNESFASAVEVAGVERWLATEASDDARASYRQYDARRRAFRALLQDTRQQLDTLYRSPVDDQAKRDGKAAIFARMRDRYGALKESWGGYSGYDRWFEQPLSNAHLAAVATYQQWVPAFLALFAQTGGDWKRFYAEVGRAGRCGYSRAAFQRTSSNVLSNRDTPFSIPESNDHSEFQGDGVWKSGGCKTTRRASRPRSMPASIVRWPSFSRNRSGSMPTGAPSSAWTSPSHTASSTACRPTLPRGCSRGA
ncbi:putative aminopeptidase [Cupriavidus gilardii J11]|uniref:Putative aminopeptidase n=1 Tax=Cupriavidus gilardii J11 TaxID=936133 RepID=A0A562B0W3_9BURK|nr:putative aminopeptidase [Cupriavidus gilardii J11]